MKHPVLLTCLLCCGLGALTSALPARPASNTDAEASDEPDLLHMLDYFKGKSDMTQLVTFLKQTDVLKTSLKGLFDLCTICKQVYVDAGKSNLGFRILDKVIAGHAPDLRDMYDLATKGIGNMGMAFNEARKKNKKYNDLLNIFTTNPLELVSSPSALDHALFTATGKNFMINPEMFKEFKSGTVQINVNNLAQVNLLQVATFWVKNSKEISEFLEKVLTPPLNITTLSSIYQHLDSSNLAKIKMINGGMNNNKYAVVGAKQTIVTDPLVEQIVKAFGQVADLQKGEYTSAESMLLNLLVDFIKLNANVLTAAETNRKVATL